MTQKNEQHKTSLFFLSASPLQSVLETSSRRFEIIKIVVNKST